MHQHHRQLEPAREGKLRAACDRCHDLKNRCVRVGGVDSRCDRCERLDIGCVYRNSSRMGRPKGQRKASVSQSALSGPGNSRQARIPSLSADEVPDMSSTTPGIAPDNGNLGDVASEETTLVDSPSDGLSILVPPPGGLRLVLVAEEMKLDIWMFRLQVPTSEGNPTSTSRSCDARCTDVSAVGYITVQQALTCYSFVLLVLDRVVNALQSTRAGDQNQSGVLEVPSPLSLGSFNLASQPALNAEMVLHLVFRMIHHSRSLIHSLALQSISHAASDFLIERERVLLGRLSVLTRDA
ncbi:hypothetical protein N657DRAFT_674857 [Parathielavia appendiculata]|uniref:Zn(2)-C6 fungal-type domain-containing protein n=1 Tax=Parathielavia appendiculata TaxID=2587402 RepID=A0AAN6Z0G5_9PEZI|nr:hypothetical protein N657DRAFT_674857 [Parathielavia appendiculata]